MTARVPTDAPRVLVWDEGLSVPSWRLRYAPDGDLWMNWALDVWALPSEDATEPDADGNCWELDEVTGFIKWDGCMQWGTRDGYLAHTCGVEGVRSFAAALMAVQEQIGPKLKGWK